MSEELVTYDEFDEVREFAKGEDIQLSKNFHLSEFECRCSRCTTTKVSGKHVKKLQAFREKLGEAIHINSGYRCPYHNARIGGASKSRHMEGDATDIYCVKKSPREVQKLADFFDFDGLGKYSSFTHVDSRGYKARW